MGTVNAKAPSSNRPNPLQVVGTSFAYASTADEEAPLEDLYTSYPNIAAPAYHVPKTTRHQSGMGAAGTSTLLAKGTSLFGGAAGATLDMGSASHVPASNVVARPSTAAIEVDVTDPHHDLGRSHVPGASSAVLLFVVDFPPVM